MVWTGDDDLCSTIRMRLLVHCGNGPHKARPQHSLLTGSRIYSKIVFPMTDNTQTVADATATKAVPPAQRMLLLLTALGGAIVVAPLFAMTRTQPWFAVLAVILLLPYALVGWRLLRAPQAKEGPGLAIGIGLTFVPPGLLLLATVISGRPDYRRLAYFSVLVMVHLLLIAFAISPFRRGTSNKPAWRVLARSILDPVVYFGIVLLLAAGAHLR